MHNAPRRFPNADTIEVGKTYTMQVEDEETHQIREVQATITEIKEQNDGTTIIHTKY